MDTTLKHLQTKLKSAIEKMEMSKLNLSHAKSQHQLNIRLVKEINEKIASHKKQELIVSEHAILRYLERVMGVDIECVRDQILTDELLDMTKTLGPNGTYPV